MPPLQDLDLTMDIQEYLLMLCVHLCIVDYAQNTVNSTHIRRGHMPPRLSWGWAKREVKNNVDDWREVQHLLEKKDPMSSILHYIEVIQSKRENCTRETLARYSTNFNEFPTANLHENFKSQIQTAIKISNILNNLFQSYRGAEMLFHDAFYYSLVRAIVESDDVIFGCGIAFDKNQYPSKLLFCPYAHKAHPNSKTHVKDLSNSYNYTQNTTTASEWFWMHSRKNFSEIFAKRLNDEVDSSSFENASVVQTITSDGLWSAPYYDCGGGNSWMITFSAPFFGYHAHGTTLEFKGVVSVDINLKNVDIDQCSEDNNMFAGTHKCKRESTQCITKKGQGFRRGAYMCVCKDKFYFPNINSSTRFFDGDAVEKAYLHKLLGKPAEYGFKFSCLPCKIGCDTCNDTRPCEVEYNIIQRGLPLAIQSLCMTITVVLGIVIFRLRKAKVVGSGMWTMLEMILFGALLLYATVIIRYFKPTTTTCFLEPWFRELGFSILYGAIILKIYRVLAEFQTRKAHRVHVRDKDLLKYLLGIVLIVIGYMSAWTAVNMDHIRDGNSILVDGHTEDNLKYSICKSHWWDYVIEVGEFLFLLLGVYLCYCIRNASSDYAEKRYLCMAIYIEAIISAVLHIVRHIVWQIINPDYIFLMYFIRCQMTVTIVLALVFGPKLWYAHKPLEDDFRSRAYSQSDVHDHVTPESMKLQDGITSNGEVDVTEVNIADMDPEDIRAELKRVYTQLQILRNKTMRKDNPHISKRRGGRKQTHRRFSLQAFHHRHRHHHDHDHDNEISKTPEESTNSGDGVQIQIEGTSKGEEPHVTPTVTFKNLHK